MIPAATLTRHAYTTLLSSSMNERALDHVGIAVQSLDRAIPFWTSIAGGDLTPREVVESQGVEVVFIGTGDARVELLAPTRDDSPLARFLQKRGPGLHHVCYRVPDIAAALAEAAAAGIELIDRTARPGAYGHLVAFLHPRSADGVLIELTQHTA